MGIAPQLSDAELVTLAMMQAMLGFTSEARWLRHAGAHLRHLFSLPAEAARLQQRLRKAAELILQVYFGREFKPLRQVIESINETFKGGSGRAERGGQAETRKKTVVC